jgi:RNA polymerase sigma-70 factor (ECF subfamily)
LDELSECISSGDNTDEEIDRILLTRILNNFLENQTDETRRIFVKRYWYMLSVTQISKELSISESKVKSSLMRSRQKLKQMLIDEGVVI